MTKTVYVTIGKYMPWPTLSALQYVSIYHDWHCQRYSRYVSMSLLYYENDSWSVL